MRDMPTLRLALAQVNPTVGDLDGNARIVREHARAAADAGAHLVAFPEMVLTGYPVEDLVFRESFVAASRRALRRLAGELAARLAAVTPDQVRTAARGLSPDTAAVLELRATGGNR